MVGDSVALRRVREQVAMVAPTTAPVLVLGESGTGKELVARAIHEQSPRRDRPIIKVNCASIPRELFESEFFGHVKGAFTGALRDRAGRFQAADGGTLFLDEIGEISLDLQAKLLRVLQEGQFEPVGDERTRTANVRVIAATNRDLATEVSEGRFRRDLYYRLGVFPITVPPLRDRLEDIPQLAAHFSEHAAMRFGTPRPRLSLAAVRRLQEYAWPGNLRELQNFVERAVILARGTILRFDDLLPAHEPQADPDAPIDAQPPREVVTDVEWRRRERDNIRAALDRAGGRIYGPGGAAMLLGIKPTTLVSKLKAMGIRRPVGRTEHESARR
jgi:transcriptional regulator with GAF, ATPase, and Fis domain